MNGQAIGLPGLRAGRHRVGGRVLTLTALFAVEYIVLSFAFNVAPIARHAGLGGVILSVGTLGPIALAIATAARAFADPALRKTLGELPVVDIPVQRTASFLAAHVLAFAGLCFVSRTLTANAPTDLAGGPFWLATWIASGPAAAWFAVEAIVPPRILGPLERPLKRVLIGTGVFAGAAWVAGLVTAKMWMPLSTLTLYSSAAMLAPLTDSVFMDVATARLGTEDFVVRISPQCSGYEGIGVMTIFAGAFLGFFRKELKFPYALLLIPAAALAVWLANSVRITSLIMLGDLWSADVAVGAFHSRAGWLLVCLVAFTVEHFAHRWRGIWKEEHLRDHAGTWNPTVVYLVPMLMLLVAAMFTGAFSNGVDRFEWFGFAITTAILWHYRKHYREHLRSFFSSPGFAIGLGLIVWAIWMLLEPSGHKTSPAEFAAGWSTIAFGFWLTMRILGSCIIVPIVEELAFRGFLLRRLISPDFTEVSLTKFTWLSFLGSSIAFGVLHQRWLAGIIAGMLFAYAQYRNGRLADAVIAHAVANFAIAVTVLATGAWQLWV